jgi:prepilin-type N-terminal cleavage/methylation domain-containing protein
MGRQRHSMVRRRIRPLAPGPAKQTGFSVAELIVVLAVIGVLAALSMPTFLSYWRGATLRGGAQEAVAALNAGRQLAIRENQTVCIQGVTASSYDVKLRYIIGTSCSTTQTCVANGNVPPCIWTGAGTDGDGYVTLSNGMQVKPPATDVMFTYLGAASPAGTFYVRSPNNTASCASLAVAASGRITTAYLNAGC